MGSRASGSGHAGDGTSSGGSTSTIEGAIEARLLGPPIFRVAGVAVEPTPSKRWLVPVYLAVQDGWVSRDELATLLWGDGTDSRARQNLRQILHALRQTPIGSALDIEDHRLRFLGQTDLEAFTREIDRGAWPEAIAHYHGPFLTGWSLPAEANADAWIVRRREEIELAHRMALRATADDIATTDPLAAAQLYERLWRHDVLDEEAVRAQLSCLQTARAIATAADVARSYRRAFTGALDAHPDGELAELLDAAESRVPLVEAKRIAHNLQPKLPNYTTPFVGRRAELSRLETLFRHDNLRLVSLVGLGGSGKTRLALEFAHRVARDDRSVVWVSLVDVGSRGDLIAAIASSLGIDSVAALSHESLADHIGERQVLVVVDNAEHLRDELMEVVEHMLSRCSRVTFLVTTRMVLGARFEHAEQIGGLAMSPHPAADGTGPSTDATSDAAALFQMASSRRHSTPETKLDALAVEQICREVEGMPLAIELIASWTDVLSAEDLLAEARRDLAGISDSGALRDLPERQRSMKHVLDGTWRHLSDDGRRALLALAPAVGSVTLADARALGVDLAGLRNLADAAIVRREGDRLSIHPLITEYARQRAQRDAAHWTSAVARHAAHYLAKLTIARKAPQAYVLELFHEVGHLRASLVWAAEHIDVHTFGHALFGLHLVETSRGSMGDPALTQEISRRARGPNRIHALGREVWQLMYDAIGDYGYQMATSRKNVEEAKRLALEALAEARRAADPMLVRLALHDLAVVHNRMGEHRAAIAAAREGLRVESDWGWTTLLDKVAHAQNCVGEYAAARRSFLRALAWRCRNEKSIANGWVAHSIALVDLCTGRYDAAARVAGAIADATGPETPVRWQIERFVTEGLVATAAGDLNQAADAFDRALDLCDYMDSVYREKRGAMIHGRRAQVALLEGDVDMARRHVAACQSRGYGPYWKGRLALAAGKLRAAVTELTAAAAELPEESYEVVFVAAHLRARSWLAIALTSAGDVPGATKEIEGALEHALGRKLPVETLACSLAVATLLEAKGELQQAESVRAWIRGHPATDADTRIAAGGPALRQAKDADTADVLERGRHLLEGIHESG